MLSHNLLSRTIPYADEIIRNTNVDSDVLGRLIRYSISVRYWRRSGSTVHQLFTDFKKAYDSVRSRVLYNILIEFGIPRKLVGLIRMCLNKTYNRVGIGKNTQAIVDARKEVRLEVNPEKTKYMLMSRNKAEQNHITKTANRSSEDVANFKYLGTRLTDQNCMNEEIKSRLNSRNACYHSVQSLLSSRLMSRTVKVKKYKTKILSVEVQSLLGYISM
jgi:hypothetical protein